MSCFRNSFIRNLIKVLMNEKEEYFVGALGDAYIDYKRNELQVYQKNLQWLENFNNLLFDIFKLKGKIFKKNVYWLRKSSKAMILRIKQLLEEKPQTEHYVAGLFDTEGSYYLSSDRTTPVIDITQSIEGLARLHVANSILEKDGIKCVLNGPYNHKHGKLPQYHLRIYGKENFEKFKKLVPFKHPDKTTKMETLTVQTLSLLR